MEFLSSFVILREEKYDNMSKTKINHKKQPYFLNLFYFLKNYFNQKISLKYIESTAWCIKCDYLSNRELNICQETNKNQEIIKGTGVKRKIELLNLKTQTQKRIIRESQK